MKHFTGWLIKIPVFTIVIAWLTVSCATRAFATLTPEQQNIKILDGDQKTTLALMSTHTSICTEDMGSEYTARVRAVNLKADVAQLIISYNNDGVVTHTFRFWKPK